MHSKIMYNIKLNDKNGILFCPLIIILILIWSVNGQTTSSSTFGGGSRRIELTNVDLLTGRYVTLSRTLWQIIRGGAKQDQSLLRIHDVHLTFYAENFNEKGRYLSDIDPNQKVLLDTIALINSTIRVTNNVYLKSNPENFKREESILFARNGVNMTQLIDKMYGVISNDEFFKYIAKKGELQSCMLSSTSTIESTSQLIYDYYNDISVAQLKAYSIVQLSFMFLTVYGVGNYVTQSQQLETQFLQRRQTIQDQVRLLLETANREIWVCDPDNMKTKAHSDEITRLLQGYIDNEVNLNPTNECKKTCSDYTNTQNYNCYNGSICAGEALNEQAELKCNGVIVDCDFISGDMDICPSANPIYRYDSIKYDCGVNLGRVNDNCENPKIRATSWTRWFVQCSQCFCYCDEPGIKSDRYFSLKPVVSNVAQNKVITAVALRKRNRIFFWEIAENKLTNNGQIDLESVHKNLFTQWKTDDFFNLNDPRIIDGEHYHTLNWRNRSINLDTLYAPAGHVITGVKFSLDTGSLKLEIRATKFDFNTGLLIDIPNSKWISNTINERTPILLNKPNIPTDSLSKSIPDLTPNKYIEFQPSDRNADVSQSTVPFIDIQTVEPDNPVPLAGIGIYYKGLPNYGGFIAPKIITLDYTPYISSS